jgi:hypothetical protein
MNVGPRGVPACDPSGDNIVAELGSEMTKNGSIVSDSDSSRSRIAATWAECPT